jgi:uncharacterized protein with NRDE domain
MCLISVASQCSTEYPFVFVGNRDEFHARASAPADWWQDHPDILGGRDLVAGGSWLGISRYGQFAVVTNRPDMPAPQQNPLSRGALVSDRLKIGNNTVAIAAIDAQLETDSQRYGGFSLLAGNIPPSAPATLACFSGGGGGNGNGELASQSIPSGIFGLSNTAIEEPWPKLQWLNSELAVIAAANQLGDTDKLFSLLLREQPVPNADTDWVSARPFISGADYGTRCATVITVNREGQCCFIERRFGPGGVTTGETDQSFALKAL